MVRFEFLDYLPAQQQEHARKELELLLSAGIPEEEITQTIWRKYKPTPQKTNVAALKSKMYVSLEGYILYTTTYEWGHVARFADNTGGINIIIRKDSNIQLPKNLPARVRVVGKVKPNRRGEMVIYPISIQNGADGK